LGRLLWLPEFLGVKNFFSYLRKRHQSEEVRHAGEEKGQIRL
jgi:hypothetical protein